MPRLFNPFDPTQPYLDPLPENPTPEQLDAYQRAVVRSLVRSIVVFVIACMAVALLGLLTACTTQRSVVVERVTHDTLTVTRLQRDSIYLHDSIYVREYAKGDTVYLTVDRWHTQYRDRWHHDSVYIARRDSIPVPYPVDRRVPAELSWWTQAQIWLGRLVICAMCGCLAVWIFNRRTWWLALLRKII